MALSALAIGSSVLIAQAIGGGDTAQASSLARQSLLWSVLLSVPLAYVSIYASFFVFVLIPAMYFLPEKMLSASE